MIYTLHRLLYTGVSLQDMTTTITATATTTRTTTIQEVKHQQSLGICNDASVFNKFTKEHHVHFTCTFLQMLDVFNSPTIHIGLDHMVPYNQIPPSPFQSSVATYVSIGNKGRQGNSHCGAPEIEVSSEGCTIYTL